MGRIEQYTDLFQLAVQRFHFLLLGAPCFAQRRLHVLGMRRELRRKLGRGNFVSGQASVHLRRERGDAGLQQAGFGLHCGETRLQRRLGGVAGSRFFGSLCFGGALRRDVVRQRGCFACCVRVGGLQLSASL